jgi:hypothetical protein
VKPELGISKALGRWTLELAPAVTFYSENDDFLRGKTRAQTPLYSVQANASYTFARLLAGGKYRLFHGQPLDG